MGTGQAGVRRRVGSWAGVVVLLVVALAWWLLTPDVLQGVADEVSLEQRTDHPVITSHVVAADRPVEILSVRPVDTPPPGVQVSFVACRWRNPTEAFATGRGPVSDHCADTRGVRSLRLAPVAHRPGGDGTLIGARDWEILAVVDLGDQSAYVTDGFIVSYRDGVRRGTQATGVKVTVYRPGHDL